MGKRLRFFFAMFSTSVNHPHYPSDWHPGRNPHRYYHQYIWTTLYSTHVMATHDRMQQIHLINIKCLTLSMLNQQRHVKHRLPMLPTYTQHQNPMVESYYKMPIALLCQTCFRFSCELMAMIKVSALSLSLLCFTLTIDNLNQ
jgi:hypothetical protein